MYNTGEKGESMKGLSYIGILIVLLITSIWAVSYFTKGPDNKPSQVERGIRGAAQALFIQQKSAGVDLSNGPCLSSDIMNGYAVDIVHNPRQAVDNLPQNQCSSYLNATVKHFIELDTEGNFVRMQ